MQSGPKAPRLCGLAREEQRYFICMKWYSSLYLLNWYRGRAAKAKIASVNLVSRLGIIGKHRLLNANYFGMFRYYLWSLLFPKPILRNIISDSKAFLWRRLPGLDATE